MRAHFQQGKRVSRLAVVGAMCSVLTLSACGPSASDELTDEDAAERADAIEITAGETEVTITTDEGVATMRSGNDGSVRLPLGFSLYPDAQIDTNAAVDHNGGEGAMVFFTTDDEPSQVAEFYREQAEAAGIVISLDMSVADGRLMGGEGPDGEAFTINASTIDGKTSAQLMVGNKLGE